MKVLVVDDQVPVVQGILSGVNWDRIGVSLVRGAFSMKDAQEAFEQNEFDVAVCDIKMPFGSGVDLVEWIKNNHPHTEAIFLTSHAEFEYAQKAVKLACFDYLIQPVEYSDLENCIRRALDKVCQKEQEGRLQEFGSRFEENKEELQQTFFMDLLMRPQGKPKKELIEAAKRVGLELTENTVYLPVLLRLLDRNFSLDQMEEALGIRKNFEKALPFVEINTHYRRIYLDDQEMLLLLELMNPLEYERLISQMKLFVNVSKTQFDNHFECYIGKKAKLEDLHEHFLHLNEMKKDNLLHLSDVFLAENEQKEPEIAGMDFGENWTLAFVNGNASLVEKEARLYMNGLIFEKKLNNRSLFAVFQKVMVSFYASLDLRKIDLKELLSDETYMEYYRMASTPKDVEDIYRYIAYLVEKNDSFLTDAENQIDIIDQIKEYIADNIDMELSREEIAGRFFLSKDYISHMFKEKTGVSLIDYINTEKMGFAKHLLETTNLPISIVSAKVGYSNFGYFSRVFKKYTDCTPNEYRKRVK